MKESKKLTKEQEKLRFITPGLVGLLIFYLLPLCYCALFSFSATSGRFSFDGVKNYESLLESGTFRMALGNTYFLMATFLLVLYLLTILLVYFLDTSKGTLGVLLISALPMLLPPTLITKCLQELNLPPRLALLAIFMWKYLGFHVLLLKVVEMTMRKEWIEAAVLDRGTKWQIFTRIVWQYLWPYQRFLLIFDVICFFRLFRENYLLYGAYPPDQVYTISHFFFNNFQNLNYQRLSSAAMLALVPVLLLNVILLKVGGRHEMV
ncbi:MAG: sugar ABC transporter permease [Lachnospiraceae bacterium]|nr:sugar ABC transporter permease [Lachnospiraceae bacterium]